MPAANKLAGANSFKDVTTVLTATRGGAAWECLGHAVAAYESAVSYAGEREQFGKPIASFQLVQSTLAGMLAEVTAMQLICFRVAELQTQGRLTGPMASMAKMHNARKAQGRLRRGPGHPRRQRPAARVPRRAPPDRHGGRAHLRGHRLHPVAHPRPGDHRALGVQPRRRRPPATSTAAAEVPVLGSSGRTVGQVEVEELLLDERSEVPLGGRAARAEDLGHLGGADR